MSVDGFELLERDGDKTAWRRKYHVCLPDDWYNPGGNPPVRTPEEYLQVWVDQNVPKLLADYDLEDWTYDEYEAQDSYEVEVTWGPPEAEEVQVETPEPPEINSTAYSFSFKADGYHLQSVEYPQGWQSNADPLTTDTWHKYHDFLERFGLAPGVASIYNGAVGVEEKDDGAFDIKGADIEPGAESFSVTYYPEASLITTAYEQLVQNMVGNLNVSEWKGYPAGTVQLVRCQGTLDRKYLETDTTPARYGWSIEFGFSYRPLIDRVLEFGWNGIDDSLTIPVGSAGPHDHIWFGYKEAKVSNKWKVKVPVSVHVERCWPYGNFNLLNLPNWP